MGSPIANRNRLEIEGLIGFFTNTLALRLDLSGDPSFWELGRRVRAAALDGYAHQDLPVREARGGAGAGPAPGAQPALPDHARPPEGSRWSSALPGVGTGLLDVDTGTAKFDLTLMLAEDGGGASRRLEYAGDLFDAATVDRLLGHLRTLLAGAVEDPGRRLSELPLLTAEERAELVAWSRPLPARASGPARPRGSRGAGGADAGRRGGDPREREPHLRRADGARPEAGAAAARPGRGTGRVRRTVSWSARST